jgi:hypothetical protein
MSTQTDTTTDRWDDHPEALREAAKVLLRSKVPIAGVSERTGISEAAIVEHFRAKERLGPRAPFTVARVLTVKGWDWDSALLVAGLTIPEYRAAERRRKQLRAEAAGQAVRP